MEDEIVSDLVERLRVLRDSFTIRAEEPRATLAEAADEIERLREALRGVEEWWLRDGMNHFDGAPSCIFDVRTALLPKDPS